MKLMIIFSIFCAHSALATPLSDYDPDPSLLISPQGLSSDVSESQLGDYEKRLTEKLAAIQLKLSVLGAEKFIHGFVAPYQRSLAFNQLVTALERVKSRVGQELKDCVDACRQKNLNSYYLIIPDLKSCAATARKYLSQNDLSQESQLRLLIEGILFRSANEFSALQNYVRALKSIRNAYDIEIEKLQGRKKEFLALKAAALEAKNEEEQVSANPDYTCHPGMSEIRLDRESVVTLHPPGGNEKKITLSAPLKDSIIQNQGRLGTCFANAASVIIEALTFKNGSHGTEASAIDLAILTRDVNNFMALDPSLSKGGHVCNAIQAANKYKVCEKSKSEFDVKFLGITPYVMPTNTEPGYRFQKFGPSEANWKSVADKVDSQTNILKAFSPGCADPNERTEIPQISCKSSEITNVDFDEFETKGIIEAESKRVNFNKKLISSLMKGAPLGISYLKDKLFSYQNVYYNHVEKTRLPDDFYYSAADGHASLITGIRWFHDELRKIDRCEYQIWNSQGLNFAKSWVDSRNAISSMEGFQEVSLAERP